MHHCKYRPCLLDDELYKINLLQALCKRTLNVVEALSNAGHGGRMRFYLSKADEAGHESDR